MKRLLILLLLVSVSFSSLLWEFNTDGPIYVKPVTYDGGVLVASEDGNVYSLDPLTGTRKWDAGIGKDALDLFVFDNSVYASATSGLVTKIGKGGSRTWQVDLNKTQNVSRLYGAAAGGSSIFATADNGLYKISKTGNATRIVSFDGEDILTAPVAGSDFVIYGRGGELIKSSDKGQTLWKQKIAEGNFWLSRPVISGNAVYAGALDRRMHAYLVSNGLNLWEAQTRNWVLSTATIDGDTAYFGSNDGKVYAVDDDGNKMWEAQTQLAVKTQPELGSMGGEEVVFVGGGDRNIYAISKENGDILWKGPSAGAVGSPLYYQDSVIFGSADGSVYSYSTERACSITNPLEGDILGLKEVAITGKYVSEAGGAVVWVSINNGEWQDTETTADDWLHYLDPSGSFGPGLNSISCMVVDAGGQESGPTFTTVAINHDPSIPLSDLIVTLSPNIMEGEEFTVYVNDGDDGSPVERFTWSLDGGEEKPGDKNVTLTLGEAKEYMLTVKKLGFNDATIKVNVSASGVNPILLVGGIIVIVVIIWQVWVRFLSQRFMKKRRR